MKYFLYSAAIIAIIMFLSACSGGRDVASLPCPEYQFLNRCIQDGQDGLDGTDGKDGKNGQDGANGVDGQDGTNGSDGQDGTNGNDGFNSLISIVNSAPTCLNGGIIVLVGLDTNRNNNLDSSEVTESEPVCNGQDGADGTDGVDGHNALVEFIDEVDGGGASCSNGGITLVAGTDLNDNGDLELAEITQSKDVCNGEDGLDGEDGEDADPNDFDLVEIIDPCGEETSFDEILIRLANDYIISSFSENTNGKNTRFTVLEQGTYTTTDGTNCSFSIDSNLDVSW